MKVMKKTLAVLLCFLMLFSMNVSISFADETVYPNGEEVTFTISNSSDPGYLVSESGAATWKSRGSVKNQLAVFRIPVPKLQDNQTVKEFKFKYTLTKSGGGMQADVYNLPGSWDVASMKLSDTAAVRADSANMVPVSDITSVTNSNFTTYPAADYYADITSFALKAIENKQPYIYMGLISQWGTEVFGTDVWSGEVNMGLYPGYSFTLTEVGDDSVYENGVETTLTISNVTDPSYIVTEGGATTWQGQGSNIKGNMAVYSIPLPKIGKNQAIKNFKFKYSLAGQYANSHTVYNLPGEWVVSLMKLSDTASVTADSSNVVPTSSITNTENVNFANGKDYVADITAFAQKAHEEGYSHVYMGVIGTATINAFGTWLYSSQATYGLEPAYTFTLKPADDDSVYENGIEIASQLSNSTHAPYVVSTSGSKVWKSRASINGNVAVYKIPLPKVSKYQSVKEFKFKFTATHPQGYAQADIYNLPGSWDLPSMTLSAVNAQLTKANRVWDYSSVENTNFSWPSKDITADITRFAVKALENGEDHVYIGVTTDNSTDVFGTDLYSSEVNYGLYPGYSFILDENTGLNFLSSNVKEGSAKLALDTDLVFAFDTALKSASVTVNGQNTESIVDVNAVLVNTAPLSEYTAYNVEVTVIDKNDRTVTQTLNFSTSGAVNVDGLTNGKAYYITAGADPVEHAMAFMLCKYANKGLGLFKLPVPQTANGYKLSSYILEPYSTNSSVFALKFEGENWNLVSDAEAGIAAMRFDDDNVGPIVEDWYAKKGATQYNAADSVTWSSNRAYIDITSYMNECIEKGQQYCYVGIISEWTAQLYGFRDGNVNSSRMSYGLSYSWGTDSAKIIGADDELTAEHVSELTAGGSYKAVVPFGNLTSDDEYVKVVFAQYNSADKLIGVIYSDNVELASGNENGYAATDAMTLDAECKYLKAFVWKAGTIQPVELGAVSEVK